MENWELRGHDYESQKAVDKYNTIWQNVIADKSTKEWHENTLYYVGVEDMHDTMESVGDTVPFDPFWGKREKYVHTQGVVAPISFKTDPNSPYTGLLKVGSETAFIRFSIGAPCDVTKPAAGNFGPNIGVKLLRDGIPSANIVATPWD